jgi:hypothetical protein
VFEDATVAPSNNSNNNNTSSSSPQQSSSAQREPIDLHTAFLYQLSEKSCLSKFSKVILISSPKDVYVPFYSARIQVSSVSFLLIVLVFILFYLSFKDHSQD